ncbi:MAG: heme exporter protein CcmB [Chitinophagales bacterium]|nr:heme exporter protein CcmB [Chitinophagaceae bacterium]MBP9883660.1 heme exporter protein CcmB [Chitinophagales bacterium]
MWQEVRALILKDVTLEWRQRYAFSGIMLYLAVTIFLVYISFIEMDPVVWVTMFWIILLFTAVNAVAKSFMQESSGRQLYYYSIAHPRAVILAKLIYNSGMMLLLATMGMLLYTMVNKSPISQIPYFVMVVLLGSVSFGLAFTMMSAIASKANQSVALMAILSLPFIIPVLLLLIKLTQTALLNHVEFFPLQDFVLLFSLDVIMVVMAVLLFPYLWRE